MSTFSIFATLAAVPLWVMSARASVVTAGYNNPTDVPVSATSYTATGNTLDLTLHHAPATGTNLTVVDNTGMGFITGQFSNLAQGQVVDLSYNGIHYPFVANYYGGTGNDLVLVWPYQKLVTWGRNFNGQLGNNNLTDSSVPVPVTQSGVLAGKTVVSVAAGGGHCLALCSDGTLAAWGQNGYGQLGNNKLTESHLPVLVKQNGWLAGKTVVAIAAGDNNSLALCSDGTVAAWGYNGPTNSQEPLLVAQSGALFDKTVVSVAAGNPFSLALCSDGTLVAWGDNSKGQLGDNTLIDRRDPVAVTQNGVLADKKVVSISAGYYYSLALCSDGTVAAWGMNDHGQFGDGTTNSSNVPVMVMQGGVLADKKVVSMVAGYYYSLALCADGTLAAWGMDDHGQLGNNSLTESHLPVLVKQDGVLSNKTVVSIASAFYHSVARCSDGAVATWGSNVYGQLGTNNNADSKVPVLVTQSGVLADKWVGSVAADGYSCLVLAAAPNTNDLSNLVLSSGTLSPVFHSTTHSYTVGVPNATPSITMTPTVTDVTSTVTVNGTIVTSGSVSPFIPLAVGTNTIPIVVTPQQSVAPTTYTLTIIRAGNYDAWKAISFATDAQRNDPAISGEMAMPAHDSITNLMKYALALPPLADGSGGTPSASKQGGYLTLTYRQNKSATDITFTVLAGSSLDSSNWNAATTMVSQIDEGDYWRVTMRDNVLLEQNPQRFMCLRVTRE